MEMCLALDRAYPPSLYFRHVPPILSARGCTFALASGKSRSHLLRRSSWTSCGGSLKEGQDTLRLRGGAPQVLLVGILLGVIGSHIVQVISSGPKDPPSPKCTSSSKKGRRSYQDVNKWEGVHSPSEGGGHVREVVQTPVSISGGGRKARRRRKSVASPKPVQMSLASPKSTQMNFQPHSEMRGVLDIGANVGSDMRMYLVVREDLKMSAGKIASQCVHAALGAYRISQGSAASALRMWQDSGEATIVVRATSLSQLLQVQEQCARMGIATFACADAGRTEVQAGTVTVVACGPASSHVIRRATDKLRLL